VDWRARWVAALAGVLIGLSCVLFTPSPASAHAVLVSTDPVPGAVVGAMPAQATLTFSEPVRPVAGKIQLIGPDGKRILAGQPRTDGSAMTIPLRAADHPRGTYLISYRVISADTHPIAGAITFSVGAPSQPPTAPAEGVDPAVRTAAPVAKYLGYAGLVLIIGPALVLAALWPRRLPRRGAIRLVWLGFGLVGAGALGTLYLQAPAETGSSLFGVSLGDLRRAGQSQLGAAIGVRLGVLVAVAALLPPVLAGRAGRSATAGTAERVRAIALVLLGLAGLVTWPLSGHPLASPMPAVTALADVAHLAAMALWLGGLVMLFGFLLPRAGARQLGVILPAWSRWAGVALLWLVVGGVLQALVEVGTVRALADTGYGRLVLAKAGLLTAVLSTAFLARRMVSRRTAPAQLSPRPPSPRNPQPQASRLRRLVGVELAATATVLALSSVLVQTTPGRADRPEPATRPGKGVVQTVTSSLYSLQVDVFPVQLGEYNTLHLVAYTPEGKALRVLEWRVTAALPARGVEPVDTPVLGVEENVAVGAVSFPMPGDWQLRLTLRTSEIDQATVTTTIKVR
jgi:copper transport protein